MGFRSIDILAEREYNYTYEDGAIQRATEYSIVLTEEIVTGKTLVNTIQYYYDKENTLVKKRVIFADGTEQVTDFENPEEGNTIAKLTVNDKIITSHSKNDSFGRTEFEELQLGTGVISRQFDYHRGLATEEHIENGKLKSTPTTQLVSKITLSNRRTISYEYDAEERITKVTDSLDGVTEYTYDELGQLLTEKINGETVNSMTYNNYGNILSKDGKQYAYDSTWKDLLVSVDNDTITYDAQGNPTEYLGHNLVWEKGRQLKSFDNIQYTYNANGIRNSKTVDGIRHDFVLDGVKILKETYGSHVIETLYDNADSVCGIIYNGTPYYFLKNLQGDVISITDSTGEVVANYTYDAWGKVLSISGDNIHIGDINPYRYRGYYFDSEINMYYLQSRYYDPEVGRFVCGDEQINQEILGSNLFSYCENGPIIGIDFDGRRTYFINGINNNSSTGVPKYATDFTKKLKNLGVKDVRTIGIYKGKRGFVGTIKGVGKVVLEMFNVDVYTNQVVKLIKKDLENKPLAKGEQLNLIGYSGGGQIVLNVMEKMNGKITNVILIGAPVAEFWNTKTKISMIYGGWDPLSWNIGGGYKSYFAGWIGHTGYFKEKNIDKVAKIVKKIIK